MPKVRLLWPCVTALVAGFAAAGAYGQQDLDAGKTGPQLFAQDCAACHRAPQGLAKTMSGGSLVSFLRQHYTSSAASANTVAAYLQATGANVRGERQKGQPAEEAKRSKLVRPGEAAPIPPAAVPQAGQSAPAAAPRQQERIARPTDATVDRQGHPSRKSRRQRPGEPATSPAATGAAPSAPAEPSAAAAVQSAAPSASDAPSAPPKEPAARTSPPAAAPSGFAEPLP